MTLALRYAAVSHVGLLRPGNEDSGYAGPRLLAVADGMGGHAAGEVASAVAISSVAVLDEDVPGPDLLAALRGAAMEANAVLRDMVAGDQALDGMGTTLTGLLFGGNRLGVLHVGDSRCYLLRDEVLTQITHDDTLVQTLVDDGRISADEASSHPQRNMILQALDGRLDVELDLSVREARAGDRYLLCSDGLTGPVGTQTLHEALGLREPQVAAERLVELALRGGGPDNITVIVADVVEGEGSHLPVVTGAAAEVPQALPHLSAGAAGRAAAERLTTPPAATTTADPPPRPRGSRRRLVVLPLVVLVLLAAATGTAYAYVRGQWYVGSDGGKVTVFRGLTGSVAGIDLSRVQQRTALPTAALPELDREDVERGIHARSPSDAARIVSVLGRSACARTAGASSPPPSPGPSPTSDPGTSPSPSGSTGTPAPGTPPTGTPASDEASTAAPGAGLASAGAGPNDANPSAAAGPTAGSAAGASPAGASPAGGSPAGGSPAGGSPAGVSPSDGPTASPSAPTAGAGATGTCDLAPGNAPTPSSSPTSSPTSSPSPDPTGTPTTSPLASPETTP